MLGLLSEALWGKLVVRKMIRLVKWTKKDYNIKPFNAALISTVAKCFTSQFGQVAARC